MHRIRDVAVWLGEKDKQAVQTFGGTSGQDTVQLLPSSRYYHPKMAKIGLRDSSKSHL
jgi:hypothetical protein